MLNEERKKNFLHANVSNVLYPTKTSLRLSFRALFKTEMKLNCKEIYIFLLFAYYFFEKNLKAQSPLTETSFSHFYFVVDSVACQTLKSNTFCKDSLFYSSQVSSKMDQGTWSGNYLLGESDY